MVDIFHVTPGTTPLIVSVPHDGHHVPADIAAHMTPEARRIPDTDWHVRRLYDFAAGLGATVIEATHSRYVVDLNRDPAGEALYPGADNTEIVPITTFDREPIYTASHEPNEREIADRVTRYWQPYHDCLTEQIARTREAHGVAVLFDAHSIRSVVPRFFDGLIPDLNFGSASGASADPDLAQRAFDILAAATEYTAVRDGRFTGGFITRNYGDPANDVHTLQLELSQRTYMVETHPFDYLETDAARLKSLLRKLLETVLEWAERK